MNRAQRIDLQASIALAEIAREGRAARSHIEYLANYAIRSHAQKMRWHKFKQSQRGQK